MSTKVYGAPSSNPCCSGFPGLWIAFVLCVAGAAAWYFGFSNNSSRIVVQTSPAGASVFVNGRLAGPAPVTHCGRR